MMPPHDAAPMGSGVPSHGREITGDSMPPASKRSPARRTIQHHTPESLRIPTPESVPTPPPLRPGQIFDNLSDPFEDDSASRSVRSQRSIRPAAFDDSLPQSGSKRTEKASVSDEFDDYFRR